MVHPRHGEPQPNGFHVGDLVYYETGGRGAYGYVAPVPARYDASRGYSGSGWAAREDHTWAWYGDLGTGEAGALERFEQAAGRNFEGGETWTDTSHLRLARRFDSTTEGSNTMSFTFHGETLSADMQDPEGTVEGREYRVIYPDSMHNFEFIGRALNTRQSARSNTFEIIRWVRTTDVYSDTNYPIGYHFASTPSSRMASSPNCVHIPVGAVGTSEEEGAWVQATEPIPAGARFRKYWPNHPHNQVVGSDTFAYEGTMIEWANADGLRMWRLDKSGTYVNDEGREYSLDHHCAVSDYAVWVPAEYETTHAGDRGTFVAHDGAMPEVGTVVRAFAVDNRNRQLEGLFLSADVTAGIAVIEAKRRRQRRGDGTFTDWENYAGRARRNIRIEGAEVFKPGAAAKPTLVRRKAIENQEDQNAITPGMILSARGANGGGYVYRGEVLSARSGGQVRVYATERARKDPYTKDSTYNWEPFGPREIDVHCTWSDGREGYAAAGWLWEMSGPSVKRVDPAFDPNRKTPHTGMKIGDLVVGLARENEYGRDTVSSWVKGVIFKWDTRYGRPIVKVTDPMESTHAVDQEVTLVPEDTYPAMADPATVSPEEFKRTLRLYLIGRHKRGDFCRGGLNTMLAAHGIPLYETRRRAVMQVTVDYDPNVTDLYAVQTDLRRKMTGVRGLSFSERSGEDIELTLESDRTGD